MKRPVRRFARMAVIFVTAAILVEALVGEKGFLATIRARREYDELARQIARMRAENARLRETARALREDPATIEEFARRELGLLRPGETLFIIKDVPAGGTSPNGSTPSKP
jgi:cell division protein FtsB